jgi:steroid 5-alpha reductase family enzyme
MPTKKEDKMNTFSFHLVNGGGALAVGAWWAFLLMTFFLIKMSGVAMLENTPRIQKPVYAEYIRRTNNFIPGSPRSE